MSEEVGIPAEAVPAEKTPKGQVLADAHAAKMREVFQGKVYKILREVHLKENERFQTPFGNKGRHGFLLEPVDDQGNPNGNRIVVGRAVLERAASEFKAVELPVRAKRVPKPKPEPKHELVNVTE